MKADLDDLSQIFRRIPAPTFHRKLPFGADDDVYYDFVDPLARTAVADTLLESHIVAIFQKIARELPGNCGALKWEAVLIHPYVLNKRRRWDRTARLFSGVSFFFFVTFFREPY